MTQPEATGKTPGYYWVRSTDPRYPGVSIMEWSCEAWFACGVEGHQGDYMALSPRLREPVNTKQLLVSERPATVPAPNALTELRETIMSIIEQSVLAIAGVRRWDTTGLNRLEEIGARIEANPNWPNKPPESET